MVELLVVFIVLLAGSFIQGVSGFGFGLIAMSFLPLLFTVKESTLLVMSLSLFVAASIAIQIWQHMRWRSLIILLSAAFFGRIGAFYVLSNYGELDVMRDFLGVFLLLVVLYLFFGAKRAGGLSADTLWIPIVFGMMGGFVGGIFAVGGPFFVFYLLLVFADDKYAYSANLQLTFLFTNSMTVILHGVNGDFSGEFLLYFLIGIGTVLVGTRLGVKCFRYISQENMRRAAGAVVALAALNLIFF
ncbi:sulfite exporter TauE/SafE family protein [Alkalicoccus halolimnae]|uniref:Probable membrane transporter protein n=1 Tax=Alkalicoccus halolimnae TaxID=1667239 RepID=A0A5C7FH43_9BACI|nr:sulfite exporter TauE/SafE family protein [Alkalicoccus halolimnae]TXF85604.1 sulfite exporter TauE/SafE family protein [Alkalicoccus halolimnae]